jgi:hypothetical protein
VNQLQRVPIEVILAAIDGGRAAVAPPRHRTSDIEPMTDPEPGDGDVIVVVPIGHGSDRRR